VPITLHCTECRVNTYYGLYALPGPLCLEKRSSGKPLTYADILHSFRLVRFFIEAKVHEILDNICLNVRALHTTKEFNRVLLTFDKYQRALIWKATLTAVVAAIHERKAYNISEGQGWRVIAQQVKSAAQKVIFIKLYVGVNSWDLTFRIKYSVCQKKTILFPTRD